MPSWILATLGGCSALILVLSTLEAVRTRTAKPALWALLLVAAVLTLLALTVGLQPVTRQPFGEGSDQLLVAGLMFAAVICGIFATYIFNFGGTFSWRECLRPIVISPLVLLPLLGSLQGAEMKPLQVVCFVVLAFQNGFFWQHVLKDSKPTTGGTFRAPQPTSAPASQS